MRTIKYIISFILLLLTISVSQASVFTDAFDHIIITFIFKDRWQKTLGKTHLFFFSNLHNNGHRCIFYYMRRFAFMNGIYSGLSY